MKPKPGSPYLLERSQDRLHTPGYTRVTHHSGAGSGAEGYMAVLIWSTEEADAWCCFCKGWGDQNCSPSSAESGYHQPLPTPTGTDTQHPPKAVLPRLEGYVVLHVRQPTAGPDATCVGTLDPCMDACRERAAAPRSCCSMPGPNKVHRRSRDAQDLMPQVHWPRGDACHHLPLRGHLLLWLWSQHGQLPL